MPPPDPAHARARTPRSLAIGMLLAGGLVAALCLLPAEFGHYRRLLDMPPDPAVRTGAALAVLSKTLLALGVACVPACAFIAWRRTTAGLACGAVAIALVLGALGLDLEVQRFTGNTLVSYAAYLGEPEAMRWAGGERAIRGVLRAGLAVPALALCAGLAAALAIRWRRVGAARVWAAAWAALIVAGPLAQAGVARALDLDPVRLLYLKLDEAMPWRLPHGIEVARDVQLESGRLLASVRDRLDRAAPAVALAGVVPSRRPNVVLIVLESFRHDVLTPEVMPQLSALADRGLRADAHHSGSNGSHYGFFSLMYGQSPVSYYPLVGSGLPPAWPAAMRAMGYRNLYVTGADVRWLGMDRFLGEEHFEVTRISFERDINWELDTIVVREAARRLRNSGAGPTFLMVYLLSTHYDYSYPDTPEHAVFQPALRPKLDEHDPVQRAPILNGYRNTARYLDRLLGPWLAGLDPEQNLIIVTGDHAESIWDDGTIMHSSRLSEVQTHVPLAIVGPGVPRGEEVTRLTTHEDVLPTVIDALGLPDDRLSNGFGRSVLRPGTQRAYVPLVQSRAPGYDFDSIALVAPEHRFAFTLDRTRRSIRFDGLLDAHGLVRSEPATSTQHREFLTHLEDYLERVSSR